MRPLLQGCGRWLFRYRNRIFPVVLVGLLFGVPPPAAASVTIERAIDLAGLGLALGGQFLRWLVIGLDYIKRGGVDRQIYAQALVTTGAFAHARNPLYVGNILILAGLFVVHGSPWVFAAGLPAVLFAYTAIVAAEEAYLRERFGETYDAYCATVPRWLPRLAGLRATWRSARFRGWRAASKDSASAYAWMTGAWLLLVRESLTDGFAGYPSTPSLAAGFAAVTGSFVIVRLLKRSRLLRDG